MTEQEWMTSKEPDVMLRRVTKPGDSVYPQPQRISERKLRLFCCACCRAVWDQLDKDSKKAVEAAENWADGNPPPDLNVIKIRANRAVDTDRWDTRDMVSTALEESSQGVAFEMLWVSRDGWADVLTDEDQTHLIREIVGNPFSSIHRRLREYQPVHNWLTWNDGVIHHLIKEAYDTYNWSLLPIAADALEEAGCNIGTVHEYNDGGTAYWWNDTFPDEHHLTPDRAAIHPLLDHLHYGVSHFRGCWAVDLLLGKE